MSTEKRKLGFYSFKLVNHLAKGNTFVAPSQLGTILDAILALPKQSRIYDEVLKKRIYCLDHAELDGNIHKIIFKTAKYNHKPPLIDKETAKERDNPKRLSEGESEKTHLVIMYNDREAILVKEERRSGVSIGKIKNYIESFMRGFAAIAPKYRGYELYYSIIPKDNFLEELNGLTRVATGEIFIEKKVIGSEYLNYAEKYEEAQDDITLTLKARRGRSLQDLFGEVYEHFARKKTGSKINRLRIHGKNSEGDNVLLDTDLIKRIEYLSTKIDDITGTVDSEQILGRLQSIIAALS